MAGLGQALAGYRKAPISKSPYPRTITFGRAKRMVKSAGKVGKRTTGPQHGKKL